MNRIIPVILFAALALCGCKDENGSTTESGTAPAATAAATTVSTTAASSATTAVSTVTATTTSTVSTETTAAISPEESKLIEEGIIPPEAEEIHAAEEITQATLPVSDDDKPIELPMIPIR